MSAPVLHNEYAGMVNQFAANVRLAQAVWAADPDADSPEYNNSVDQALALYEGLNEVHSSLEMIVDSLPGGRVEDDMLDEAVLAQADQTADRIIAWQRQIKKVMIKLHSYADSEFEPKDADPLIQMLQTLPQRP